jgi:THO complex subunit 4
VQRINIAFLPFTSHSQFLCQPIHRPLNHSTAKMDQSLDQIIAAKPKPARRGSSRRTSARTQILGNAITSPSTRARQAAAAAVIVAKASPTVSQPADKIIVSNLPQDVNEIQIKVLCLFPPFFCQFLTFYFPFFQELFHSTVGPLREVTLHYDSAGRSKGVAAVQFQRKGDGSKAYQQYNNRLIDGS